MTTYKLSIKEYADNLIESYKNNLLTGNDLNLLNLMFTKQPTQEELSKFLETYDIEVAGGFKALMLTYFMRMHPNLQFTSYEDKRLKGLFNFYRFQNMRLFSSFIKIGKIFNQNDIPMLILKGFAMKYLRPDLARAMGDIDILVPENRFVKAIKLCKKMGYRMDIFVHSIDLHEPSTDAGLLDIHRYIDMKNRKERPLNKYLFKRATKTTYSGIEILVPCIEDLFFLALINLSLNLKCKTSKPSTLFVLFDIKYFLSKKDFNWNIVFDNIKLTHTQENIAFAVQFINNIIPNLIPKELAEHKIVKKYLNKYCIDIIYHDRYFKGLQHLARKTKIKAIKNKKITLKNYLSMKILYKMSKFASEHKIMAMKEYLLLKRDKNKSAKR